MRDARVVIHEITFTCAAEHCDADESTLWTDSLYALRDPHYHQRVVGLPEGWQEVEGRAYCPKHDVEVTATVRTPTLDRIGRNFVGGFKEELVELRRSYIDNMMDEMYNRARAEPKPDLCSTMAQGCVGDERAPLRKRAA